MSQSTPRTDETRNMFGAREFGLMKDTAYSSLPRVAASSMRPPWRRRFEAVASPRRE